MKISFILCSMTMLVSLFPAGSFAEGAVVLYPGEITSHCDPDIRILSDAGSYADRAGSWKDNNFHNSAGCAPFFIKQSARSVIKELPAQLNSILEVERSL